MIIPGKYSGAIHEHTLINRVYLNLRLYPSACTKLDRQFSNTVDFQLSVLIQVIIWYKFIFVFIRKKLLHSDRNNGPIKVLSVVPNSSMTLRTPHILAVSASVYTLIIHNTTQQTNAFGSKRGAPFYH